MIKISLRVLRDQARKALNQQPGPSWRETADDIMDDTVELFALHRPCALSFAAISHAVGVPGNLLKACFSDMDGLLGGILLRHLGRAIDAAASAGDDHDHAASRRAYLKLTRDGEGKFTRDHRLLMMYRFSLAPDQLPAIEAERKTLADCLGGFQALELCDCPSLLPEDVERMLAVIDERNARSAAAAETRQAPALETRVAAPAYVQAARPAATDDGMKIAASAQPSSAPAAMHSGHARPQQAHGKPVSGQHHVTSAGRGNAQPTRVNQAAQTSPYQPVPHQAQAPATPATRAPQPAAETLRAALHLGGSTGACPAAPQTFTSAATARPGQTHPPHHGKPAVRQLLRA